MLTVGSLFAGIGGFDLGLERAGMRVRWQVEIDPYCQRVLAKHWPYVQRYGDIRTIDWGTVEPVDLLCGGFPCQDISLAGKGAGLSGERSGLWFEYAKAIEVLRPSYVLIENVSALRSRGLDQVLGSLAALGYDAEWHCIPACAVGAPHRRDRVWVVAYANQSRSQGYGAECGLGESRQKVEIGWSGDDVADSIGESAERRHNGLEWGQRSASKIAQNGGQRDGIANGWWAVEPPVGRVAHGIPRRVDRLRGLGNAIVPQIATFLGERILAYDQSRTREAGTVLS